MAALLTYHGQSGLGRRMLFHEVQDQVQHRASLLLAGRFDDLSLEYLFPLPIYLNNHLLAFGDASQGIERASAMRDIFAKRQIETLTITVLAIEIPRSGRFRVWADWHAISRQSDRSRRLGLTYFMRDTGHGIRSEMLQYHTHGRSAPARIPRAQTSHA